MKVSRGWGKDGLDKLNTDSGFLERRAVYSFEEFNRQDNGRKIKI